MNKKWIYETDCEFTAILQKYNGVIMNSKTDR